MQEEIAAEGVGLLDRAFPCDNLGVMRNRLPTRPDQPLSSRAAGFVIGRDRFARISAVEGIVLTDEMRATLESFDRDGLSAEERRNAILRRFGPGR